MYRLFFSLEKVEQFIHWKCLTYQVVSSTETKSGALEWGSWLQSPPLPVITHEALGYLISPQQVCKRG